MYSKFHTHDENGGSRPSFGINDHISYSIKPGRFMSDGTILTTLDQYIKCRPME